jgi:hypothetical protein
VKLCAFSWFSSGCKSTRKDSHQKIFFKLWGSLESSPTFNKPTERKFVIEHYIAMFVVLFYSDLDCCTRRKCFFFLMRDLLLKICTSIFKKKILKGICCSNNVCIHNGQKTRMRESKVRKSWIIMLQTFGACRSDRNQIE